MTCTDACWEPDTDCLLEDDPTLADCCRRDLEEQKHVQNVKQTLLSHDRTDIRIKLAHHAFFRDLNGAAADRLGEEESDTLVTDSDEDAGLQEVREKRLRQLQQEMVLSEATAMERTGTLQDVPEQQLLVSTATTQKFCMRVLQRISDCTHVTKNRVIREASSAAVVCHISKNGTEADAQLDELLTSLAHQFRNTLFLRTSLSGSRSPFMTQLGIMSECGLVCFKDGDVSNMTNLDSLGSDGDIYEEKVVGFLKHCGALRKASNGAKQHRDQGSESEGEESDWQEPCMVCGRRYYHEHVRSMSKGNAHDEDADDV